MTVNLAISVFTGCEIAPNDSRSIEVEITDLKFTKKYANLDAFLKAAEKEIVLVQKVVEYFRPQQGFHLSKRFRKAQLVAD